MTSQPVPPETGSPAHEGFHPDLTALPPERTRVHHVRAGDLDAGTAQTGGMRRFAAISGARVGSERMWMGQTHVAPATASADHHHGDSETAIYVVSGHPEFVFVENTANTEDAKDAENAAGGGREVRLRTGPGDYVFVPPFVPHREENPDPREEAVVVIARSTQEAIVVNLPGLYPLRPGAPDRE